VAAGGRTRRFDEGGGEVGVAVAGGGVSVFSGGFVVGGHKAGPGGEVVGGGNRGHVHADLEMMVCATRSPMPGMVIRRCFWSAKGSVAASNLCVELVGHIVEVIDVLQVKPGQ